MGVRNWQETKRRLLPPWSVTFVVIMKTFGAFGIDEGGVRIVGFLVLGLTPKGCAGDFAK